MHLLIDTHILIWWLKDDKNLSKHARTLIKNADIVYVSSASIWEAAIKVQLGKLAIDIEELSECIESEGFIELPISIKHAAMTASLPHHHRDPFDRMLVAQALSEPLKLVTADKKMTMYTAELVELV